MAQELREALALGGESEADAADRVVGAGGGAVLHPIFFTSRNLSYTSLRATRH